MVLEKLGDSLKGALSKIARSIFVDEKLIDELVKELQRSLLKADANVKQVFDLSKKIKERALKEKPPAGMSQKEYLIKIVYDELVNFLGGEGHKIDIKGKKPFKIMLVGLFGSGKCIHGKSNVLMSNGRILPIEEIYNSYYQSHQKNEVEDGEVVDISNENLEAPSLNPETAKIEHKKVTHIWKLKKNELIEVKIDNGNDFSIKVTPEHPFFVLREGFIKQIRADELSVDDVISIPRGYDYCGTVISLLNELKHLDVDVYLSKNEIQTIKNGRTILEMYKKLKKKRNYCQLTEDIGHGKVPIELLKTEPSMMTIKYKGSKNIITTPTYLTPEYAEFLGYLVGDGTISKKYISFVNEDPEIIDRIINLSKLLFNIIPSIKKDKRTKKMYKISLSSKTLVKIMGIFGLKPGKKGPNLRIPRQILESRPDVIIPFIRAYFDCDSYPNPDSREIELVSESRMMIKQMNMLLLRFGIASTISKKIVKNKPYFRLLIRAKYAEKYSSIGFLIKRKRKAISSYERIGLIQGCGKQDMIPLGASLKALRLALGFSIGEIQREAVTSYGAYEEKGVISRESLLKLVDYYSLNGLGFIYEFLSSLRKNDQIKEIYSNAVINGISPYLIREGLVTRVRESIILTNKGNELLATVSSFDSFSFIQNLLRLADSDVCWLSVLDIKKIKNDEEYVYDLTIEDNHCFIAEGVIVHNTTATGKIGKFFQKRGYKIALVCTDTWRPAAYRQLETLGKQINVPVFGDPKEKDAVKIYKSFEKELDKFDVVIIDSAGRDALNKELIEEIKKIGKYVNADEILLVISADIGQAAERQAQAFHDAVGVTGIVVTKMDGTAKGGGALAGAAVTKAPVKFIGVGEKIDDLEVFEPTRFVSRILGMGDLETLLEKAREAIPEEQAKDMSEKLVKGDFSLIDLYEQMGTMKKMGPLSKIVDLIPGFGKMNLPKDMLDVQEEKLKKWRHIMDSMTRGELEDPDKYLDAKRIERIAKGSGTSVKDVRELIKQYRQSKKLMRMMKGQDPTKLMKKFKGKLPGM